MPRTSLLAATLAALFVAPTGIDAQTPDGVSENSISVIAPRVRESARGRTGIPVQRVSVDAVVTFDDLDLRTETGEEALEERVREAAEHACDWLDELYPLALPEGPSCTNEAVRGARSQMAAAVTAARQP